MDALLAAVGDDIRLMESKRRTVGAVGRGGTKRDSPSRKTDASAWRSNQSSSRYRGVSWHTQTGRWKAQIKVHGKDVNLGRHKSEEAAARAYDQAAINARGKEAQLNFPLNEYDEEMERLRGISLQELAAKLRGVEQRLAAQTSRYHGVRRNKRTGKWEAYIRVEGKHLHLGCHASETEAARAFDRAAVHELSRQPGSHKLATNFPVEDYAGEVDILRDTPLDKLAVKLRSKEYADRLKHASRLHETKSHLSDSTATKGLLLEEVSLDGAFRVESPTQSMKIPEVAPNTPQQTPTSRPVLFGEGMECHGIESRYHCEPSNLGVGSITLPLPMYPNGMPQMTHLGSKRKAEGPASPRSALKCTEECHVYCPVPRFA